MTGTQKISLESSEETTCEEWRDVPGFDGVYQVSNLGRVRSLPRKVWNYTKPGRIMADYCKPNGYKTVGLSHGGKHCKHAYVHRLVAQAFIPNPENLPEINHKNFDKKDNRVSNLEWVTSAENKAHFRASQYAKLADERKARTLNNKSIQYILDHKDCVCTLYDKGFTIQEVSEQVGIGRDMVRDILVIYERI